MVDLTHLSTSPNGSGGSHASSKVLAQKSRVVTSSFWRPRPCFTTQCYSCLSGVEILTDRDDDISEVSPCYRRFIAGKMVMRLSSQQEFSGRISERRRSQIVFLRILPPQSVEPHGDGSLRYRQQPGNFPRRPGAELRERLPWKDQSPGFLW